VNTDRSWLAASIETPSSDQSAAPSRAIARNASTKVPTSKPASFAAELEQSVGPVPLEQGGDVDVVTWSGPSPQREHLVRRKILRMQNRAYFENDSSAQPTAIREDLDCAVATSCRIGHHEPMIGWRLSASRVTKPSA
jgi:hypothetical protein